MTWIGRWGLHTPQFNTKGPITQQGECLTYIQDVIGSSPIGTTIRRIIMIEKGGKIVEITEQELLDLYLKKEMDDIMSFQEYKFRFEEAGCVVEKMWDLDGGYAPIVQW